MIMVVTLDGQRRLTVEGPEGRDFMDVGPGHVYLTSLCGTKHEVSYPWRTQRGRRMPDLGEVGTSMVFRTALFKRSPWGKVRPGPEAVWLEFNRVLAEVHAKFTFRLPTLVEMLAARQRLVDGLFQDAFTD